MGLTVTPLAGKNATATINGVVSPVTGGSLKESVQEDEVTSLKSGGFYESVPTIKKMELDSVDHVYDSAAVPTWGVGSSITSTIAIPSGSSFSGTVLILSIERKYIDVKGAYHFVWSGVAQGSYTMTN